MRGLRAHSGGTAPDLHRIPYSPYGVFRTALEQFILFMIYRLNHSAITGESQGQRNAGTGAHIIVKLPGLWYDLMRENQLKLIWRFMADWAGQGKGVRA